jgi:hypothetical protein
MKIKKMIKNKSKLFKKGFSIFLTGFLLVQPFFGLVSASDFEDLASDYEWDYNDGDLYDPSGSGDDYEWDYNDGSDDEPDSDYVWDYDSGSGDDGSDSVSDYDWYYYSDDEPASDYVWDYDSGSGDDGSEPVSDDDWYYYSDDEPDSDSVWDYDSYYDEYAESNDCWDECAYVGKTEYSGNSYRTCGNYDSDCCLEWSQWYIDNPDPSCSDECSYSGQHECSGTSGKTCGDYDSDCCLEWSSFDTCDSQCYFCGDGTCDLSCGETSSNCSSDCGPSCSSHDNEQCYSNDLYWYDSCGAREEKSEECGSDSWTDNYRCSGNVVQKEKIERGCNCDACYDNYIWEDYEDCSNTGRVCQNDQCVFIAPPTLYVNLEATPSSGEAPLNNVDLRASVSGSAEGTINYKFDCENDGSWDKQIFSTNSNPYTALDVCDYSSAGNYTARVMVEREDASPAEDTVSIYVHENSNEPPEADAGSDRELYEGDSITLYGYGYDPDGGSVDYRWSCSGGSLYNSDDDRPTFNAPSNVSSNRYYTCTLTVEDNEGLTDSDSASILVKDREDNDDGDDIILNIRKAVKNLTRGDDVWYNSLKADPGDLLMFRIRVTSEGSDTAYDVKIEEDLPNQITYKGDLEIDGDNESDDITEEDLEIGDIRLGDTKIITFEARVESKSEFDYGRTDLINEARAYNSEDSDTDDCKIMVDRKGVAGASTISTGITDNIFGSLVLPFALSLLLVWLLSSKLINLDEWAEGKRKMVKSYQTNRALQSKIIKIKTENLKV